MGTHITSNIAEEAALRYTPNNWDLAGSLTGIYGVVKKAGEHLATVSRWLGEKSVVQEKMSALGLGASALGFGLMAKSGFEALERKLGFIQAKSDDPTQFQDTNTLIQTLLMGVNLVRKSKQAQFLSLVVGSGLDLWDIFSNWDEAPSGQNWMRLGMFAFFNTGSHNQARLSEAAEQSATYAAHVASRIKPQHLAGGLGMLASNEAWASTVGGHAVAHPVLWGGGVLAGAAVAVGRRFGPEVYASFMSRYYRRLIGQFPEVTKIRIGDNLPANSENIVISPYQLKWDDVVQFERRYPTFQDTLGTSHQISKNGSEEPLAPHHIFSGARILFGDLDLKNAEIADDLALSRQAIDRFLEGSPSVPFRLGYFAYMEERVDLPPGTLGGIALGYNGWPSLLGGNPTPQRWLDAIGRFLMWKRRDVGIRAEAPHLYSAQNGSAPLLSPGKVNELEEYLTLPPNTILAFLLDDPGLVGINGNINTQVLSDQAANILSVYNIQQLDVANSIGSPSFRNKVSRLVTGKGTPPPSYSIRNVALLEQGIRVAIARSMWIEGERGRILRERNSTTAVGVSIAEFRRDQLRIANIAGNRIKNLKNEVGMINPDDLVTRYQDQLPPVGFLMRYAFGVGDAPKLQV